MLGWIKNRSDHPLADEKGAKEFLSELPTQEMFPAELEFSKHLPSLLSPRA